MENSIDYLQRITEDDSVSNVTKQSLSSWTRCKKQCKVILPMVKQIVKPLEKNKQRSTSFTTKNKKKTYVLKNTAFSPTVFKKKPQNQVNILEFLFRRKEKVIGIQFSLALINSQFQGKIRKIISVQSVIRDRSISKSPVITPISQKKKYKIKGFAFAD